jgi:hypothetical protein
MEELATATQRKVVLLVNAIARISHGASSIADNIKAFNESPSV